MNNPAFIETRHLKKYFKTPKGSLHAVDDISLTIAKGETLGVVGESGCGKVHLGKPSSVCMTSRRARSSAKGKTLPPAASAS